MYDVIREANQNGGKIVSIFKIIKHEFQIERTDKPLRLDERVNSAVKFLQKEYYIVSKKGLEERLEQGIGERMDRGLTYSKPKGYYTFLAKAIIKMMEEENQ